MPTVQTLENPLPRLPHLLRMSILQLALAQLRSCLGFRQDLGGRVFFLLRVHRQEHALDAAQVRGRVFLETAGQEGARGVAAGEEVVGSAGPVGLRRDGYVVDGAVEGQVDWFTGGRAVVLEELHVGEVDLGFLEVGKSVKGEGVGVRSGEVGVKGRRTRHGIRTRAFCHSRSRVHFPL